MYSGFAGQLSVQQPSEATLTFLDSEADGHVERVQVTSPDGGRPLDGGEGRVRVDDQLSCRLQHVTAALVRTHGRQTTHGTATTPQQTTHGTVTTPQQTTHGAVTTPQQTTHGTATTPQQTTQAQPQHLNRQYTAQPQHLNRQHTAQPQLITPQQTTHGLPLTHRPLCLP